MNDNAREARDFLLGYRTRLSAVESAANDYANADTLAHSLTAGYGGTPSGGSPSRDKMADAAASMMDHADAILANCDDLTGEYLERTRVIVAVGDVSPLLGDILRMVYVDGKRIGEVQKELSKSGEPYSRSSIYRLHERALTIARDVMKTA